SPATSAGLRAEGLGETSIVTSATSSRPKYRGSSTLMWSPNSLARSTAAASSGRGSTTLMTASVPCRITRANDCHCPVAAADNARKHAEVRAGSTRDVTDHLADADPTCKAGALTKSVFRRAFARQLWSPDYGFGWGRVPCTGGQVPCTGGRVLYTEHP